MYYHIIVFYTLYTARNSAASGGTPAPTAPADHVQLRPVRLYIHIHIHIYIFVYLYVSLSLYIYIYIIIMMIIIIIIIQRPENGQLVDG